MYKILRSIVPFSGARKMDFRPVQGVFLLSVMVVFLLASCSDSVPEQDAGLDSMESDTSSGAAKSSPEIPPTLEPSSKATVIIDGPESDAPGSLAVLVLWHRGIRIRRRISL